MSDTLLGYALATSALLLFTAAILLTKGASSRLPLTLGFLVSTVVNVLFGSLAFAVQLALRTEPVPFSLQAFWLFLAAGVFSTYLGRWFFYESVVRFGPAKASIFQVSSPIFTALMAWLLLGEQLTLRLAMGMLLAVAGLILVSYKPGFFSRTAAPSSPRAPTGRGFGAYILQSMFLLGLGSSMAYAVGNVVRAAAIRSWNEPILGALLGAVTGLALHLAFTPGKAGLPARFKTANRSGIWLYALIGSCTICAQIFFIGSMRYIPVAAAAVVTLCTPLLVFPLNHLLFKGAEKLTGAMLIGSALALVGVMSIVLR